MIEAQLGCPVLGPDQANCATVCIRRRAAVLEVEFRQGRVYQYLDVPPEEFDALMAADSKGRFVNGVIKPAHRYRAA